MLRKALIGLVAVIMVWTSTVIVGAAPITYESVLYYKDYSQCDTSTTLAQLGLTATWTSTWTIGMGQQGTKCLIGTNSSVANHQLTVGDDATWSNTSDPNNCYSDYTIDVSFRINQAEDVTANGIGIYLFSRSVGTLNSGANFRYTLRNPVYYSAYSSIYRKENAQATSAINSGPDTRTTDTNAAIQPNKLQRVTIKVSNGAITTGATITHNIMIDNDAVSSDNTPYNATFSKWYGATALYGKPGLEFYSQLKNSTIEIYSFKVTGKRTTNIIYKDAGGTELNGSVPANSTVTVSGKFGSFINNAAGTNYSNPVMVSAIYDGDKLYDVKVSSFSGLENEKIINVQLNTPPDASNAKIKTFFWNGTDTIVPIVQPFVPNGF